MEKKERFTSYIKLDNKRDLRMLSENTRVPIAAYIDEAIEDLLKKYKKDVKEKR